MNNSAFNGEDSLEVLRLLAKNPSLNQRDIANSLGISLGKANYCIKALVSKGFLKVQNFKNSHNKLAYMYLLTPLGIAEKTNLTGRFLKYKMGEYERLSSEIRILELEVSRAAAFSKNDGIEQVLDDPEGRHA